MDYKIITLLIISISNAIFTYFIIRGKKNTADTFFSLVTLSVSLWSLNLAFFIEENNLQKALSLANFYYIFAAGIPLFFFYFSSFFLRNNLKFSKKYLLFSLPFFLLIGFFLINENFLIKTIFIDTDTKNVVLNWGNYILYIIYFFVFVISSYIILIKKYLGTKNSIEKLQLNFIIIGTIFSYTLGIYFNLLLPATGVYQYIWMGPLFSIIMVLSIGYAIIQHHLFNKKVIATEILTISIIFFILIRTIISESLQEQIINALILIAVSISSILLIRSVIKEVKTREEIEKLAENLKRANNKLKKMDEQKSEFINIASHQLRGPATSLKGYSSMILEGSYGPVPEKISDVIKKLYQSSQALAFIIDDFLNLSRIEMGKIKFIFLKTDIKKIIREATEEIKQNTRNSKIKLIFTCSEEKFESLADAEKIRQAISNLLDNAIKYTPKGSIEVALTKNKKNILIKITDTGIGLPKNTSSKLFKKFSRLENANTANIKGTGLGLYLAKKIVMAHKGKIWATSKGVGKGTSFFVQLKCSEQQPS